MFAINGVESYLIEIPIISFIILFFFKLKVKIIREVFYFLLREALAKTVLFVFIIHSFDTKLVGFDKLLIAPF